MAKVLRIINRFNLGGPTYNVAYLSRYISAEFDTMLTGGVKEESENSSEFILEDLGLKPHVIKTMRRSINPLNDLNAYKEILEMIREFRPDIVHTHASKAGALGRVAAIRAKVPIIVHTFHGHVFHSYFNPVKTGIYKNIERFLAKRSDCIIAISDRQKHELSIDHKICEPEKIRVIPLGFDLTRFHTGKEEKRKKFRAELKVDDDTLMITIIGRLVPVKNHQLFLRAIQYVKKKSNKKIRAVIVGDGSERAGLEALCKEQSLPYSSVESGYDDSVVSFTSWITQADVVCAGSDIICLTSFNEGTPVSLIEAQAANVPVISTRVGGVENIVSPDTALLSDVEDEDRFCQNLLKLVEEDDLRKRMSEKGWDLVGKKFHYTRLVDDMEKLYRELLTSKGIKH
jgi:glycosyltransferase involved in cell wall biosynthesis